MFAEKFPRLFLVLDAIAMFAVVLGLVCWAMLMLAKTYLSMTAVKNALARIKDDYDVEFRKARLELKP